MNRSWKQYEGQMVNEDFCLRQYLGAASQSAVFLTERSAQDSQKAVIKLIPAESANAELQLSRWISAAALSHPNLLKIFQAGRCRLDNSDLLYVVTEYAEENLAQILLQRALTPEEARDMLDPVLDALLYLHGKGFVHGGIKPANIMAVADQLKISSDGIRPLGSSGAKDDNHTAANLSPYNPPETVAAGFSPAGDVWSLGMALVEILTQRLPVWSATDQRDPQLPETARLPQPFLDIARNSLLRDPARRWTVGQIAARLQPNAELHPAPISVPLSSEPPLPAVPARPGEAGASSQVPAQQSSRLSARAPQESRSSSPRYIVPVVAGVLILAGIIVVPRLFNQHPKSGQSSAASKGTSAQLAVPNPIKSPRKSNTHPAAIPPSANSLKPPANAKSSAANNPPAPAVLRTEEKRKPAAANPGRGEVLSQVLPDVSTKARDTIRGTVKIAVRVHVGPAGGVTAAELDGAVPSRYFADLALRAARDWTFQSPESAGRSVPSEWLLRFYFTSSSTKAVPEQTMP
jgi:serine/threonine protein kinase